MATRMLQRRGTAAEWAAENPILADGELGFESDTKIIKMGDGLTPWLDLGLPYLPTGGGTMTGALNLIAPTADAHAVRKIDLDNKLTGLQEIVRFTSSGSFIKANYPWARMLRVLVQAGGGGGGGAAATNPGEARVGVSGGAGGFAESILSVDELLASEPVSVGAGGPGGPAGSNVGADGGPSSFGSHLSANPGVGGGTSMNAQTVWQTFGSGSGGTAIGDFVVKGSDATIGWCADSGRFVKSGEAGSSFLGRGGAGRGQDSGAAMQGLPGTGYGSGGSGAAVAAAAVAVPGGDGAPGIVIVELYA